MKNIFPTFKSFRKKTALREKPVKNAGGIFPRLILAIIIIAAIATMYTSMTIKRAGLIEYSLPDLKVGDISPNREIALIDFQVPKSSEQLQEERKRASEDVLPVFSLDRTVLEATHSEIDTVFSILGSFSVRGTPDSVKKSIEETLPSELTFRELTDFKSRMKIGNRDISGITHNVLKKTFEDLYDLLIVSRKDDLKRISSELIMLDYGQNQQAVNIEEIVGVDDSGELLEQKIQEEFGDDIRKNNLKVIQNFAVRFIRPNLHYNATRTGNLRRQATSAVPMYAASYKKNQLIIEANVSVTASHQAALEAYRKELKLYRFEENRRKHYTFAFGKTIVGLGIIGIIIGYFRLYRRRIYTSFSQLLLLAIISALPLSVAYYSAWSGNVSEYLIPVAVATILTTILFDAETGIMMSVCVSLLVTSLVDDSSARIGIIYFLAGSAGVLTVGRVRHRKEFYRAMFFVPLTMVVIVAATTDWLSDPSFAVVGKDMFLASINGFFCPIIAIGLLPLLESVFKIVTDITLLELTDLNNSLLKEMAVNAPGTFSGSLMVGALAEAAAEKTRANPILARVGAYYHDIGKIVIPEYFIENQFGGENPHDRLSPHMSALVLASHVKEGYELGVKNGLPEAILDIIRQHHGTSLMASIYKKAEEKAGNNTVDKSTFRYPGPKPQTRETGIVMLADLVEAASRSVNERAPGKLKSLINTIIQMRFLEGELDECDLTLKDLHNIEKSFLPVLLGSQHSRIEYPWQKEEQENEGKNKKGVPLKSTNNPVSDLAVEENQRK